MGQRFDTYHMIYKCTQIIGHGEKRPCSSQGCVVFSQGKKALKHAKKTKNTSKFYTCWGGVQKVYLPCLTNIFRFFQLTIANSNHTSVACFLQDDVSLAAAADQWAITFSRDRLLLWCLVYTKTKSIGIPLLPMELI